ncbi:hypothetical protein, partial [Grimontia marina]|uniref:hypothetical protein n=1 Tax=Grimontia marina TaxID=646534 RepID=UPI001E424143
MKNEEALTKHKTVRAEVFGQRLWGTSAALSASHVGQLIIQAWASHTFLTNRSKHDHYSTTSRS